MDPVQKMGKSHKASRSDTTAEEIQCFFQQYQNLKRLAEGDIEGIDLDQAGNFLDKTFPIKWKCVILSWLK